MSTGGFTGAFPGGMHSSPACPGDKWSLVVPFKGGPSAKSRLQGDEGTETIPSALRRQLALGFLADTVAAAAAAANVGRIIIISSDPAAVINAPKVLMLQDSGHGLNAAIDAGFIYARSLSSTDPVAAVTADLPRLTTAELEYALQSARHQSLAIVPDRDGSGTTMITALPGVHVSPLFGPGSRDAHTRAGHRLLPIPGDSTLRMDVDTVEDLVAAVQEGVGEHTRAALLASGIFPPHPLFGGHSFHSCPSEIVTEKRKPCPAF